MSRADYVKTLFLAAVVVAFLTMKHAGFMVVFLGPFFLVVLIQLWRKPSERKRRAIKLVIWAGAVAIIGSVHWYWAYAARIDANTALAAVLAYKTKTGSYPSSLAEVSLNERELRSKWKLGYSLNKDGRPFLLYATTFTTFEAYSYDFDKSTWHYNPD